MPGMQGKVPRGKLSYRRQRFTCPACEKVFTKVASFTGNAGCCSIECYMSLPFPRRPGITSDDVERAYRMRGDIRAAAKSLGVSYAGMRRATLKLSLREQTRD